MNGEQRVRVQLAEVAGVELPDGVVLVRVLPGGRDQWGAELPAVLLEIHRDNAARLSISLQAAVLETLGGPVGDATRGVGL